MMRACFIAPMMLIAFASGLAAKTVMATSFADPADIAAFKRCVAQGRSERSCLAVGDNGVGLWGDRTDVDTPICALPRPEWTRKWGSGNRARGRRIAVTYSGRTVVCELRDTLPSSPKNGAGIDLNPGASRALGLAPPFKVKVVWEWAE